MSPAASALSRRDQLMLLAYARGYRVNAEGRVVSPAGQLRAVTLNAAGYPACSIRDDAKRCGKFTAHRLAAYQLFGDAVFAEGIQVRHLDGNPLNNRPENLALGTASENAMDKTEEMRQRGGRIAARARRKLTDEQLVEFHQRLAAGWRQKELRLHYGISRSTASYIANGITYPEAFQ